MSREGTKENESSVEPGSLLLMCVECGEFYPGETTDDGDLVPVGALAGGRCPLCDGNEFEQVVLDLAD